MIKQFLFTISCCVLSATVCFSQPGNLDGDFDGDGKLTVDFDGQDDKAYSVVVQPDGKVIVAGYSRIVTDTDFSMARFNTDGTFDATFGLDGKVSTSFSSGDEVATAILLQPDGKIILAGQMNNGTFDFAMARYTTSGALDITFSDDGLLYTDFTNSADVCNAAALQPDGKIILAGESWGASKDFALVRYNSDGTLDNSFGSGGKVTTLFPATAAYSSAKAVIVQPDGKIVAAGVHGYDAGDYEVFALARYNSNGTLDNTFSVDGKVTTALGVNFSGINSIALQPNGYILAAGHSRVGVDEYMAIARYKTDGTLDTGFDGDGKVTTDNIPFIGRAAEVVLQADGKIIAAGLYDFNFLYSFGLVRLNQDGSSDNTFGTAGAVYTSFTNYDSQAYAAAIQPDLKIVLAGGMYNGTDFDFAVARYLSGLNLGALEFSPTSSTLVYPNPIDETTVFSFELATSEVLSISIYDVQGREIKTLVENQIFTSGKHELSIDASSLSDGHYTLVLANTKGKTVVRLQK